MYPSSPRTHSVAQDDHGFATILWLRATLFKLFFNVINNVMHKLFIITERSKVEPAESAHFREHYYYYYCFF